MKQLSNEEIQMLINSDKEYFQYADILDNEETKMFDSWLTQVDWPND